ncbi:MAG: hypothetical protein P0Y56_16870 [Candidatus Andeanibacterium colombiense]|uniref:Uncharacterized protein n=1 Tax=Candidatus Andeanibacterium colombiense TaxID=3121345 RepID=A0AAJ5X625_9SPHN|nr:MAG: hypothetical protein P0Y56_16870 [Sphingomonadaceae bacterium]
MAELLNGVFRAVSSLLGLAMIAFGGIWILQGLGIAFLNSFMANQIQWSVYGVLLALVGIGQVWWSNTRESYYRGR